MRDLLDRAVDGVGRFLTDCVKRAMHEYQEEQVQRLNDNLEKLKEQLSQIRTDDLPPDVGKWN